MAFTKGATVAQVIHPITGVVTAKTFNDDTDQFEYLVDYTDADGNTVQRWFTETELEAA